jgi:murein DD-endopeptidase MepM/ murein hydrolase activator NlpD
VNIQLSWFMRTLFTNLFIAIFLMILIAIVKPLIESAVYAVHIASIPAPDKLNMPVADVRATSLQNSWHAPRDAGRRRHEGIDIFAPRGTRVRSTTEGIVLRVAKSKLGGNVIWVLGPGGQRHYYAHLDRFAAVHAGMRVQAGTVLGYVGNSGNAAGTPPHLHYGIYTAAGAINPYPFLRPAAG